MRILVTGGAGFIGSCYTRQLLDGAYPGCAGATVTVVDSLTYAGNAANLPARDRRLTFVQADIRDRGLLLDILPGHDAVVHFAAESHVDRSIAGATPFFLTNVVGTQVLLECAVAAKVPRVVHVSTDEVYGSIATGVWTEDCPLLPNSPYAASKAGSDLVARAYWRTHGLDISITRCSNNYGPYQHIEKVIPSFVTRLLDGLDVPLYGEGQNAREWLHVSDHCAAIDLVLRKGRAGEVYNVAGGIELTNRQLTGILLGLCGAGPGRIRNVEDRKGHDLRYALDDRKIRDELGYAPAVAFDKGIVDVVTWYRENEEWWRAASGRAAPARV